MTAYYFDWIGGSSTLWNNPENWKNLDDAPYGVPESTDEATFDTTSAVIHDAGSAASVDIEGTTVDISGGSLNLTGIGGLEPLWIGRNGAANSGLLVGSRGTVTADSGASNAASLVLVSGYISVGFKSKLTTTTGGDDIGYGGTGDMMVISGAQFDATEADALHYAAIGLGGNNGTGSITIDGGTVTANAGGLYIHGNASWVSVLADSTLRVNDTLGIVIADSFLPKGTPCLGIEGANAVCTDTGDLHIGGNSIPGPKYCLGSGTVLVSSGGKLSVDGGIYVGDTGNGTLTIENGGAVTTGALCIGVAFGSAGAVTLEGTSSQLKITGSNPVIVGDAGVGTLTISKGAVFNASSILVENSTGGNGSNGTIDVEGAALKAGSLSIGAVSNPFIGAVALYVGGSTSSVATIQGSVANNATIEVGSHGTVTIGGAVTGTGLIKIDAGGSVSLKGSDAAAEGIDFVGTGGHLTLKAPAGVKGIFTGFTQGDEIFLSGVALNSKLSLNGDVLTITPPKGASTIHLNFSNVPDGNFALENLNGVTALVLVHSSKQGTLESSVTDNGTNAAGAVTTSGAMTIGSDHNGSGNAEIFSGRSLELQGGNNHTAVNFQNNAGDTGTLILDHSVSTSATKAFVGAVAGFNYDGISSSDVIDLENIAYSSNGTSWSFRENNSATNPGGTLTVTDASGHVAQIHLLGQYLAAGHSVSAAAGSTLFSLSSDTDIHAMGILVTTTHTEHWA